MDILYDFRIKQNKYIPNFPKANGKPTIYIEGYPCEDDEPMAATAFHGLQINTFFDQLSRYFSVNDYIHVGVDSFIYFSEGDITKVVAPDIFVVFGVDKYPLRRSFYTWAEGAVPVAVFEFLSDSTSHHDRNEKVNIYLTDIGVQEYFIHQPEMEKPSEFSGWRRTASGKIIKIEPEEEGGLFSESLNLHFRWTNDLTTHVRILTPFLPDGTPINTSTEEERLRKQAQRLLEDAEAIAAEESALRRDAEARLVEARQRQEEAERLAKQESEEKHALEAELGRLKAQIAKGQDKTT